MEMQLVRCCLLSLFILNQNQEVKILLLEQKAGWTKLHFLSLLTTLISSRVPADQLFYYLTASETCWSETYIKANARNIDLHVYCIVPNATHSMMSLDKGVFGHLKAKLHFIPRKYSINKNKKLWSSQMWGCLQFYKPLTIINAFNVSGLFPVDSQHKWNSETTTDILY